MVLPVLKNQSNMAPHKGGMESSALNINQGYPLIDWSNVPTPNIPAAASNSTQHIKWEANCQLQEKPPLHLESANDRMNTMLQNCNEFFSSQRVIAPPSEIGELIYNTEKRFQNVSPVDQQQFNNIRPVTPPVPIPVTEIFSPNTINEVRSTIRALFPNGPPPPPPVVPVKRHKKGDTPYIVGCTKRRQIPEKKSLSVFTGGQYGITTETNCFDDEECPTKRRCGKRNQYPNWSKSRFNPKSEEIGARLKRNENVDMSPKSPSNYTVSYMSTPYTRRPQIFTPLPSTSKDSETIMKNEKQFSESLKYEKFNVCNYDEDDDDLPDVQWGLKNISKNQRHYSLSQSKDQRESRELICNEETSVKSEDLNNNNNNNSSPDEVDLCEIQFDKYMPKKEFPVRITTTTTSNDPIIIDEIDLVNVIEAGEPKPPKQEVHDSYEINDDYNSITHEDLYSIPKATEPIDVDELFKELNHFQQKKKLVNQEIITIVDPTDIKNSYHQKTHVKPSRKPVHSNENDHLIANQEPVPEARAAAITVEAIETPDSVEPTQHNNQPSTSDVILVRETIVGDRNNSTNNNSTESDSDRRSSIVDQLYGTLFPNDVVVCEELLSLHEVLSSYSVYLKSTEQPRSRRKKTQKSTSIGQPQGSGTVNNENAAPSTNRQANTPADGEKGLGDCPICMDNLVRGAIASTTCGHVFCLDCIKKCLQTKKKCPTCRKTLKGPGYHQVFL